MKKKNKSKPDSVKKVRESNITATQNPYRKDLDKAMSWLATTTFRT